MFAEKFFSYCRRLTVHSRTEGGRHVQPLRSFRIALPGLKMLGKFAIHHRLVEQFDGDSREIVSAEADKSEIPNRPQPQTAPGQQRQGNDASSPQKKRFQADVCQRPCLHRGEDDAEEGKQGNEKQVSGPHLVRGCQIVVKSQPGCRNSSG